MTWQRSAATAAAALLVLLPTACAVQPPLSSGGPGPQAAGAVPVVAEPLLAGQRALVVGRPRGSDQPLVLFLHGAGGDRLSIVTERVLPFTQDLVERGYLVAASDAHGDAWGATASQQDYERLHGWVAEHHDVGLVVLVSESMGGIAGLHLLAADALPRTAGWIGISPVTDLAWAAADERLSDSVAAALDAAEVRRLDPMAIPPARFAGETLVVHSASDDTVVPRDTALHLADRLRRRADVTLRRCPGEHADAACYQAEAVDALLGR